MYARTGNDVARTCARAAAARARRGVVPPGSRECPDGISRARANLDPRWDAPASTSDDARRRTGDTGRGDASGRTADRRTERFEIGPEERRKRKTATAPDPLLELTYRTYSPTFWLLFVL